VRNECREGLTHKRCRRCKPYESYDRDDGQLDEHHREGPRGSGEQKDNSESKISQTNVGLGNSMPADPDESLYLVQQGRNRSRCCAGSPGIHRIVRNRGLG